MKVDSARKELFQYREDAIPFEDTLETPQEPQKKLNLAPRASVNVLLQAHA